MYYHLLVAQLLYTYFINEFKAILHLIIQIRQIPRHMTVKITGQRARPAIGDCVHPAVHQSAVACRRSAAVESVNCEHTWFCLYGHSTVGRGDTLKIEIELVTFSYFFYFRLGWDDNSKRSIFFGRLKATSPKINNKNFPGSLNVKGNQNDSAVSEKLFHIFCYLIKN